MRLWRRWRSLHLVQRWALRIIGWTAALHFLPIWPYIPACFEEASIFRPPRLRPEALAEVSSTMNRTWWRHVVAGGHIWMAPFQTGDLDGDFSQWQANLEHRIVARIAQGMLSNGTRIEVPAGLLQAIEDWRADAVARRPLENNVFLQEDMRFSDCGIQRVAFLPDP